MTHEPPLSGILPSSPSPEAIQWRRVAVLANLASLIVFVLFLASTIFITDQTGYRGTFSFGLTGPILVLCSSVALFAFVRLFISNAFDSSQAFQLVACIISFIVGAIGTYVLFVFMTKS